MSFHSLGLIPDLLRAVGEQGYEAPTPIQAKAIPVVLEGRDLMVGAQTGTGKTAAFTLPMLQRLVRHANPSASPARHPVRALVLTPTRELAMQVEESVRTYGRYVPMRTLAIFGGVNANPQIAALRRGVEILVATPYIRELIQDSERTNLILEAMEKGQHQGMQTFDMALAKLVEQDLITYEDALSYATSPKDFARLRKGIS